MVGAFKYACGMSDNGPVISDEAVEAALKVVGEVTDAGFVRQILDAAAPYIVTGALSGHINRGQIEGAKREA